MRVFSLFLVVAVGCTSDTDLPGSDQPMGGESIETADMISAVVTTSDGDDETSSVARIVLANTSNLCADAGASPPIDRKGQHFVAIELRDVSGAMKTAPTAPGVYTIYPDTGSEPAKSASFTVGELDGTCQLNDDESAAGRSGTVTLTSVTAGVYAGTYDVVLNTGVRVTGSFAPTACPQLANAVTSDDQHSCT